MGTNEKYKAQAKYDAANTKVYTIKLNRKTDADLMEYLLDKNVQGEIKEALRIKIKLDKHIADKKKSTP